MCGITGTIFDKKLNKNSKQDSNTVLENLCSEEINLENQINNLYNFSIKYKSDINFIKYYESSYERK